MVHLYVINYVEERSNVAHGHTHIHTKWWNPRDIATGSYRPTDDNVAMLGVRTTYNDFNLAAISIAEGERRWCVPCAFIVVLDSAVVTKGVIPIYTARNHACAHHRGEHRELSNEKRIDVGASQKDNS